MDREARDPIELLDEIADQLQLECVPMDWPVGMGLNFRGVYDLAADEFVPFAMRGEHPNRVGHNALSTVLERRGESATRRRGRAGARRQPRLRSRDLSRRPSDAGLFRLGAEEFRRHRTDRGAGATTRRRRARSAGEGPHRSSPARTRSPASSSRSRPIWIPNHRDRVAFLRLVSGKFRRGMKLKQSGTGKAIGIHNPILFFASGARDGGRSLARRHHRHSQSWRLARRRHAVGIRQRRLHRHSELRAGNAAPRAPGRSDEAEASDARARKPGRRGRHPGLQADDRRAMGGGRGGQPAARRAARALARRIRPRCRSRTESPYDTARWIRRRRSRDREIPRGLSRADGDRPRRRARLPGQERNGKSVMRPRSSRSSHSPRPANAARCTARIEPRHAASVSRASSARCGWARQKRTRLSAPSCGTAS